MLGQHAHGSIIDKFVFVATHLSHIEWLTAALAAAVVATVVLGWKYNYPGALIALVGAIVATKVFDLHHLGIEVIGAVPPGLPALAWPNITPGLMITLLPTAFSIAVVILAQSLAVIRSSAARHDEKVNDNQDLMALGLANATSALVGGFAINGSPPRTSAGELAGGRSQLVNVIMSILIGLVLVVATGLFAYVPQASLAAIVFTIGLHLVKVSEMRDIWVMRRSEFAIAMAALVAVALMGVQKGVMLAVLLSLVERLRRQYHPHDDVLLRDQEYAEWAADRFAKGKNPVTAPAGVLAYRFNDAIFFENSGYFLERATKLVASAKQPVRVFILDASAITDVDYTAAQTLIRLIHQLDTDDIQFCLAHAAPRLRMLFKRYGLIDLIGAKNIFPNLRFAIEAQVKVVADKAERIEKLGMKPQDYVVIGGAALELMEIRSTNDIDLVVSQAMYDKFKDTGWKEFVHDDGKRVLTRDGYHLMLQWMGRNLHDLSKTAISIGKHPVMSADDLVECKIKLGRRKDLEDVILIKSHEAAVKQPPAPRLRGQAATA
jgi:MFS superfamily sulfate permease-like transporter